MGTSRPVPLPRDDFREGAALGGEDGDTPTLLGEHLGEPLGGYVVTTYRGSAGTTCSARLSATATASVGSPDSAACVEASFSCRSRSSRWTSRMATRRGDELGALVLEAKNRSRRDPHDRGLPFAGRHHHHNEQGHRLDIPRLDLDG